MIEAKIYEDPITRTKLEGRAQLIRVVKVLNKPLRIWQVRFFGERDIPEGSVYERKVNDSDITGNQ